MVLGLGSRNRRERSTSSSSSADPASISPSQASSQRHLHIRVQEIKPWPLASDLKPSNSLPASTLILRWSRHDKIFGSSMAVAITAMERSGAASEGCSELQVAGGAIVFEQSFEIKVAMPNRTRSRKSDSLEFKLLEAHNLKGQPLAHASVDMAACISGDKLPRILSVPLTISKKLSSSFKGINPTLHLTLAEETVDDNFSDSISDASSTVSLNGEGQRTSVAGKSQDHWNGLGYATDSNVSIIKLDASSGVAMEGEEPQATWQVNTEIPTPTSKEASSVSNPTSTSLASSQVQETAEELTSPLDSVPVNRTHKSPATTVEHLSTTSLCSPRAPTTMDIKADEGKRPSGKISSEAVDADVFAAGSATSTMAILKEIAGEDDAILEHDANLSNATILTVDDSIPFGIPGSIVAEDGKQQKPKGLPRSPMVLLRSFGGNREDSDMSHLDASSSDIVAELSFTHVPPPRKDNQEEITQEIQKGQGGIGNQELHLIREFQKMEKPQNCHHTTVGMSNTQLEDQVLVEEATEQVACATKVATAEALALHLTMIVNRLEEELMDVAAVEAALYSVTAEHGGPSSKVHSAADKLTCLFIHVCKQNDEVRRASFAKNIVAGFVLVARQCGDDVPRLSFWWSNAVVLRERISTALNILPIAGALKNDCLGSESTVSVTKNVGSETTNDENIQVETKLCGKQPSHHSTPLKVLSEALTEPSSFAAALERVEVWIYTKLIESVWQQVFSPQLQGLNANTHESCQINGLSRYSKRAKRIKSKKPLVLDVSVGSQESWSLEYWKKAFFQLYDRLCPGAAAGLECGCLPMLKKMISMECASKLDVAMFNGILHGCCSDEVPTSSAISELVCDTSVLLVPTSILTFAVGAQLKNAVSLLSSWLARTWYRNVDGYMNDEKEVDKENKASLFPLTKAIGDLLMLPKNKLVDKALREEVFPSLSLSSLEMILRTFKPDEFSPEPVRPDVLAAINAERAAVDTRLAISERIVATRPSKYVPPSSSMVRHWIMDSSYGKNHSIVVGASDDEVNVIDSSILWLFESTAGLVSHDDNTDYYQRQNRASMRIDVGLNADRNCRFRLLHRIWSTQ